MLHVVLNPEGVQVTEPKLTRGEAITAALAVMWRHRSPHYRHEHNRLMWNVGKEAGYTLVDVKEDP